MRKKFIPLLLFIAFNRCLFAQEVPSYRSNTFAVNLTQLAINEISLSYEHQSSIWHSIEFNAGLIYVNDYLVTFTENWTNTHIFSEHGFAARIGYKFWQKAKEGSKSNHYIEPMLIYKYLFYNSQWFKNKEERIYQNRFRDVIGFDFIWGDRLKLSNSFSLDLYFGAGLRGTFVARNDLLIQTTPTSPITEIPYGVDKNFYVRPYLSGGIKLVL
jgi:hypothetical protein